MRSIEGYRTIDTACGLLLPHMPEVLYQFVQYCETSCNWSYGPEISSERNVSLCQTSGSV